MTQNKGEIMEVVRNDNYDYDCQLSCNNNKRGKCQLRVIEFDTDYDKNNYKGACSNQDVLRI
jgi:hypothetical protein